MEIPPAPSFCEAVRQVLGIKDLIPGPQVVIPALRDPTLSSKITVRHAEILRSPVCHVADGRAQEMKRRLDSGETAESMGFGKMENAEMIASEWKCWFDEEINEARKTAEADADE
jgi:hypothetical protein